MRLSRRDTTILGLLFLAYLLLLFYNIDYPVWNKDEGLYADAVREMIERGNYLDPYFNYEHRWQKPILIYWVLLPFAELFGPSGWSLRLGLVALGIGTLWITWLWSLRLFDDRRIAFLSAFFLISSAAFIIQTRHIVTHLLLLFTILLSFYFLWELLRGNRSRRIVLLFGASVGLAFLAKLYVGVVFILTTGFLLGAGEIWRNRGAFLRATLWGLLAFALVALPWYLYMIAHYGDQYLGFLYHEFFDRITKSQTGRKGPLFYVGVYFANYAPWSIPLAAMGLWALWRYRSRSWEVLRANRPLLLVLTAFFVVFVTLSIPKSKLPGYLFSLQGFAAILTAYGFVRLEWNRAWKALFLGLQLLLSVALLAIWWLYFDWRSLQFLLVALLLAASFLYPMGDRYGALIRVAIVGLLLFFSIVGNLYKEIAPYFAYKRFGERIVEIRQKEPLPVYAYRMGRQSLPFYARTKIRSTRRLPDDRDYLLMIDVKDFGKLPQKPAHYEILDRALYYRGADSQVFKILNMTKGYRSKKKEGEWMLLRVRGSAPDRAGGKAPSGSKEP
ncbi:ArnT family glycosyltransferase [Nitratifractor sp.]